jgi:hypothetical protein
MRAEGVVVEYRTAGGGGDAAEEARLVDETDILVTRYQSGATYAKVCLFALSRLLNPDLCRVL